MTKMSKKDQDRLLADLQEDCKFLGETWENEEANKRQIVITKKEHKRLVDMLEASYIKKACGHFVEEIETVEHYDDEGNLCLNKFGYYKTVKITKKYIQGNEKALSNVLSKLKPEMWGDGNGMDKVIIVDDVRSVDNDD